MLPRHRHDISLLPPFVFAAAVALLLTSCTDVRDVHVRIRSIPIGDSLVHVVVHTSRMAGLTYVNLHDDEDTAVEAALEVIRARGGRLIELKHTGERRISFSLSGETYSFDPNRIFTQRGVDSTLMRGGGASPEARLVAHAFADSLLTVVDLPSLDVVVTVHNNSAGRYSVRSYLAGGEMDVDARFVHVAGDRDEDDFFFVTTENLYDAFRSAGHNVVMQDPARVTDDGSLSVLCGMRGIPYVNVEAEHGHKEVQREMLELVDELWSGD